jgi:hypothetical protein
MGVQFEFEVFMVGVSQGRLFGCNRCLSRRHQKMDCCRQKEGTTQGRDFPQTVPSKRRERLLPPNRRTCHVVPLVTVLPTTSECLELPRVLTNAHSDPHAQRFSSVVPPLMTVRLPAVNRNVQKSARRQDASWDNLRPGSLLATPAELR